MSIVQKSLKKHPIYTAIALYIIFSLFSVLLDLLRNISIFHTDVWFVIKLGVLCIVLICFMKCLADFLHFKRHKNKKFIPLLSVFIIFVLSKLVFLAVCIFNQTDFVFNLYDIMFKLLWAIGIGVSEEILCRGLQLNILLNGCYKTPKTVTFAVLVSSLIFSLGHISNLFYGSLVSSVFIQSTMSFCIGACFALLYIYSGSLKLVIILHSAYDFVGFVINDISFVPTYFSELYFIINCIFILVIAVMVSINLKQLCEIRIEPS